MPVSAAPAWFLSSTASTTEFTEIADVADSLVLLTDGSVALVMATTALNFGLLSEREQEATILAFAAFINSLSFSVQVVVRSQKKDIAGYLKLLKEAEVKQKNLLLAKMMAGYRKFVAETVREKNVLEKRFYVVIPFSALELGVSKSIMQGLKPGRKRQLPFDKRYILEKAKTALVPKRDHLVRQFNRLGLKTHQLDTQELIQLFFEIYNPESAARVGAAQEYVSPLVGGDPRYQKSVEKKPAGRLASNQVGTDQPGQAGKEQGSGQVKSAQVGDGGKQEVR